MNKVEEYIEHCQSSVICSYNFTPTVPLRGIPDDLVYKILCGALTEIPGYEVEKLFVGHYYDDEPDEQEFSSRDEFIDVMMGDEEFSIAYCGMRGMFQGHQVAMFMVRQGLELDVASTDAGEDAATGLVEVLFGPLDGSRTGGLLDEKYPLHGGSDLPPS